MVKSCQKKGFTLIELLVVMSIISLLSSVVFSSLNNIRMKARDARRVSDLRQIRNALELYFDKYGYYPQSNCGWDCNNYRYSNSVSSWNSLATDLAEFISALPVDPINSDCPPWTINCYSYTYGNVGKTTYAHQYDLTAQLEDTNNPNRCAVRNWRFYFDNSLSWCTYNNQIYEASF
ncbi:MAG TPA: prepilin-type N-terminal cleavage/methylation domain-containing protein [Candidatus Paceibacterota bacterium]